ncbi:hypothetical protein TELCIR_15345, partial [Teladorsagia circumcincta]
MPVAAIIADTIYCAHGGISPFIDKLSDINKMYKNGYRISFDGRLVTLFSAPNYMNYKNNSCVLTVTKKLQLNFTVFRCRYYQFGKKKKMAKEKKVKKDVDKKSSESEQDILDTADSKPPVKTPKKEPSSKCALRSPKLPETIESGKKSPTVESHSTKAVRKHTPKARTPKEQ